MEKKSWFGGFVDKIKNVFKPEAEDLQSTDKFQAKTYTQEQQQFISEMFDKFSKQMKSITNLTTQQQLALYGLYKQSVIGDCNISQPPFYEQENKYKYKAWMKMKGLSKTQAKQYYIQAANQFSPTEQQDNLIKRGGQSFSNSVPRPKIEQEVQYDHPYFKKILDDQPIQVERALLLQKNSVPNILPLHFAIDNQKVEYVKLFLRHLSKDQVNIADGEGMTTIEYAQLIGNDEILKLIQDAV